MLTGVEGSVGKEDLVGQRGTDAAVDTHGGEGSPHVAKRVAETDMLAHVVARLQEIERSTGLERTLAIGELILTQFFGGNPSIWHDRRRNKNNSIRRLAERPDCPYGKSALNEAVGVFVSVRGLPCVRTFGHISSSHVAAVLRLPLSEQEPMLRRAEDARWSVRKLKREVVLANRNIGERRGRPALDDAARGLRMLGTRTRELEQTISSLSRFAPSLDPGAVRASMERVAEQVDRLKALYQEAERARRDEDSATSTTAPGPVSARGGAPLCDLAG